MCGYADSLSICAQRLIAELLSRPQGRRARSSTQLIWVVGWFLNGYELATAKLTVSIATALDLGPCIMGPQVSLSKSHFISQLSLCIMETHPSKSLFISQRSLSLLPTFSNHKTLDWGRDVAPPREQAQAPSQVPGQWRHALVPAGGGAGVRHQQRGGHMA